MERLTSRSEAGRPETLPTSRMYRRGYTIFELLAVVSLAGIVTMAAFVSMRTGLGNFGGGAVARTLALELESARRLAIVTGDDHFLHLGLSGSNVVSHTIYRDLGGSTQAVDRTVTIPDAVTVTMSLGGSSTPSFAFEGNASSAFNFTVAGDSRTWQVSVNAVTGRVSVAEL